MYIPATKVHPGWTVTFPLRVVGESDGSVPGTVLASTVGAALVKTSEITQEVDLSGSNITYTVYSTEDSTTAKSQLILQSAKQGCKPLQQSIQSWLLHY